MWLFLHNKANSAEVNLGAAVGVEDRFTLDMAGVDGHLHRVDDQGGAHLRGELPAHDHPGRQVEHGGEVEPAFPGFEVGDVIPVTPRANDAPMIGQPS